jgi:CCR4-NOT transcription complex subunit 4
VASSRAVLAFNDRGWDAQGFLPRVGNTVATYDKRGVLEKRNAKGEMEIRPKTIAEVEGELVQANKQVLGLTEELKRVMALNQKLLPLH